MDRVKWTDNKGVLHYGQLLNEWEFKRMKRPPQIGFTYVNDATRPVIHEIPKGRLEKVPYPKDWKNDEYNKYVEAEHVKAQEASDKSKTLKGKMFTVGVADGFAAYVITKATKKTATVEWRGFCLDEYRDQFLGHGGTFPRDRIEQMVGFEEGMNSLFKKGK